SSDSAAANSLAPMRIRSSTTSVGTVGSDRPRRPPSDRPLRGDVVETALREGGEDAVAHVVDGTEPVDLDEEPALAEDVEQRSGLALVDLLAVPDRLLGVVDATLLDGTLTQSAHHLVFV